MKKLVFTAFAVVAFSGVAMANTVEAKEEVVLVTDCENWAMDFLDNWDSDNEASGVGAHDVYRELVEMCDSGMS